MLGFSLKPGEFVAIGDVIVRFTQIKHGSHARLAICAAADVPVMRLNAAGDVVNCNRSISRRIPNEDPSIRLGPILLILSCGHDVTVSAATDIAMIAAHQHTVDCPECRLRAGALKAKVVQHFDQLAPATDH